MSELFALFVTCPKGVEPLLAKEIGGLGAIELKERQGGVAGRADQRSAYRICLWSRLASRVLMPLSTFPAADPDALYAAAGALDWTELFDSHSTFAIEVAGHSPHLTHTQYAGLKVKDAIVDQFRSRAGRRPDVDTAKPDIRIHLYLDGENATLSLDLAGESLHKRGYRTRGMEAPLKENLAAAILTRADWPAIAATGAPFLDPMCGSGTLVLEAALMAADIAPGLQRRSYGFEAWLEHRPKVWQELQAEAHARREAGLPKLPKLIGQDIDPRAWAASKQNAERAGLGEAIEWKRCDVTQTEPPAPSTGSGWTGGLVATNPPYGERLGGEAEIIKLYSLLGTVLKDRFGGWHAAIFTGRPDLGPRLGLRAEKMYSLYNGALPCKLLLIDIPQREGAQVEVAEDFANRLKKNLKHLAKWAERRGVGSYRLYDADLPDYNVALDLYRVADSPGGAGTLHAHVQEYAAPKTVDPIRAEKRLRQALATIQRSLELPASRIHFKIRKAQRGAAQYDKHSETRNFHEIDEHGCKLAVNFEDYLDTGIFLDHRPLRLRLQQEAEGKRFLNLFCYTATATVHAFKGGAAKSLSVDMSATYLDWAERNLQGNGVRVKRASKFHPLPENFHGHWLLQADCRVWLKDAAAAGKPQFDLILLDPPTFSNSKRMEGVLDIQRDHAELIQNALQLLAADGALYFSTNRRSFKLDAAATAGAQAKEITGATLDEDFKRPPPAHRCWRFQRNI